MWPLPAVLQSNDKVCAVTGDSLSVEGAGNIWARVSVVAVLHQQPYNAARTSQLM